MIPLTSNQPAPLLSGLQTVQSIRDTGYKGTDYAIAELIDNAFDADAKNVSLVLVEEYREGTKRRTPRVTEIWVLDDGLGMAPERANLALSFGGSGNYDSRNSIGRFGMGLPQASVSQCRTTELWSWQQSQIQNAHRTVLDLNAIEASTHPTLTVPWPTGPGDSGYEPVPQWVCDLHAAHHEARMVDNLPLSSGTVVRWSNLDRLRWVKASSVVSHTEYLLGRIYRRFLTSGECAINIIIGQRDDDGYLKVGDTTVVRPNDPMYLSAPRETNLEYWEKSDPNADDPGDKSTWTKVYDHPPFEQPQPPRTYDLPVPSDPDRTSRVTVTFSQVKPEGRPEGIRNVGGHTHLGKHTKNNRGISVMRADRELLQEQTLVTEATDRWWAVEVDFSPELDELFGVTNNKQDTPYFTAALRYVTENSMDTDAAQEEALFDEDNPISTLWELASDIHRATKKMSNDARKQRASHTRNTQVKPPTSSVVGSEIKKDRAETNPTPGERAYAESGISEHEAAEGLKKNLKEKGVPDDVADVVVTQYRDHGIRVHFIESPQSQSPAFFWGEEFLNDERIYINSEHPAFAMLLDPLRLSNEEIAGMSEDAVKKMLGRASDSMSWLLQSFIRMELEVANDSMAAERYQEVRENWGKRLRELVAHPAFAASVADQLDLDDEVE